MATTTTTTIIAAFRNATDAQAAAQDLRAAGVPQNDIYLAGNSSQGGTYDTKSTARHEGGIAGWFKSIFGSDDETTDRASYERTVSSGNYVLRVDAREDQISSIEDILNRHSPIDIDTDSQTGTADRRTAATTDRGRTAGANASEAIPVIEEELQVGKRRVLRGGVRVYSRVVERPVEEKVALQDEHVRVERRPVDRPATNADLTAAREEVVEVEEFTEQPVVSKQARVVEEIRVGKDVEQRQETVRGSVRHTEVDVQPVSGQGSAEATRGRADVTGRTVTADDTDFRSHFQSHYGNSGASYDDYGPAYTYGSQAASDPRYRGRSFDDVESDLRSDYGRRYPNSTWERMKDSVRYGWDKVTGKQPR